MSLIKPLLNIANSILEPLNAKIVNRSGFEHLLDSLSTANIQNRDLQMEYGHILSLLNAANSQIQDLQSELNHHKTFQETDEILQQPSYNAASHTKDTAIELNSNNTDLINLIEKYDAMHLPVNVTSMWTEQFQKDAIELKYFRGDNAYVWQYRGMQSKEIAELRYLLTTYYIKEIDRLGLLSKLQEDDSFGIYTFEFDDELIVSRDLLDSILEIYFLDRTINIFEKPGLNVLDIGAGYGRLAYRMVEALPNIGKYYCADAIAVSTFLSKYYLRYRGVDSKAITIPLYEIENSLQDLSIDLAINIHSFSECPVDAICWWLDLLQNNHVKYLMIVPNDGILLRSREIDGTFKEYINELTTRGYKLLAEEPKFNNKALQLYGVHPSYYFLFELT